MTFGANCCNAISETTCSALFGGMVGGLAASCVCPGIGFVGGALFGIGMCVGTPLVNAAMKAVCADHSDPKVSETAKTLMLALSLFGSLCAGWALVMAAGLPITFGASLLIGLAMIPAAFLVDCCCPCIGTHTAIEHGA